MVRRLASESYKLVFDVLSLAVIVGAMLTVASTALGQPHVGGSGSEPARQLIVGTKDAPPFAMRSRDGNWDGIGIELWRHVASDLHVTFRFEEASSIEELLANSANGKYDAAIAAITVTAAREKIIDFSQPYYTSGLGIAVPAKSGNVWASLQRVFLSFGFFQAIFALVSLAIVVGSLVWALERRGNVHFGGGSRGLASGVWWSAIAMT